MASSVLDVGNVAEEGLDIADAWGLETPPIPERQIDKLLVQIGDYIDDLDKLGAADAVKKYRKELVDLAKKANKNKKEEKLVTEATGCLLQLKAELNVPVREAGVNKALDAFRKDAGPLGKKRIAEFEKEFEKAAKEKDPEARCDAYFELEREIIKADLYYQEKDNPGSTWQTQVEFAVQDAVPKVKVGKLKEKLEKPPLSAEEWADMGKGFTASYAKKIADMAFSVPEESVDEFTKAANDALKELEKEYFSAERLPENRAKLGKALMVANTAALQKLGEIKRDYPAETTPQVFVKDGKMTVAKQAPKLESLVLQGGGGKGVGYPAMLEEMNKSGMLDNVDLLVGTSIGALNASCLACGGLEDEREILNLNIMQQAFDAPGFKKKYPDVTFGKGVFPSCAGQMAKMDELTSKSITEKLKGQSEGELVDDLVAKLRDLDDETLERLGMKGADDEAIQKHVANLAKKVKHQDFGANDRTSQMITFRDLAVLHQLDPKTFKELTITGWEGTGKDGKVVYFNAKDFGDMPVALAARVSMGLPVFAPLYWNKRGPFYDGGIGSNAPTEATPGLQKFYEENDPGDALEKLKSDDVPLEVQEAMSKTMLMTFDEEGKANEKLFGEGRRTAAPDAAEQLLVEGNKKKQTGINPEYGSALKEDATKVYNSGVNTFQVFHGGEGTMSLGVLGGNPEQIEYAENIARMKGLEQIDQRADQAVAVTCKSADEALATFTDAEKKKFLDAGLPDNADPMVQELFNKCRAYLLLDDVCKIAKGSGDSTTFLNEMDVSLLAANHQSQVDQLKTAYADGVKGTPAADELKSLIAAATKLIGELPSYLRAMVKATVLVPLQQKNRSLGKEEGPPPSFLWKREMSAKAFEQSVQGAASAKVFPYTKDAKGVYEALQSFEKHYEKLAHKKKDKDRVKEARETLTRLELLLRAIATMGKASDYSGNATMQQYLGWLTDRGRGLETHLRSVVKGEGANFPKNTFKAWDKKDWEKNKKGAVDAGALEDPGATGLGAAMEAAEKADKAATSATKPDEKTTAGKAAWTAWDQVIRAAKAVQALTENANFSAYLESCVTQATAQRNNHPAP